MRKKCYWLIFSLLELNWAYLGAHFKIFNLKMTPLDLFLGRFFFQIFKDPLCWPLAADSELPFTLKTVGNGQNSLNNRKRGWIGRKVVFTLDKKAFSVSFALVIVMMVMDFHWRIFLKKAQLLPYKALFHHKLQSFLEFQNSPIQPTTPHPPTPTHTHLLFGK